MGKIWQLLSQDAFPRVLLFMSCLVNVEDIADNSGWITRITEKCVRIYISVLLLFVGLHEVAQVKNYCSK